MAWYLVKHRDNFTLTYSTIKPFLCSRWVKLNIFVPFQSTHTDIFEHSLAMLAILDRVLKHLFLSSINFHSDLA